MLNTIKAVLRFYKSVIRKYSPIKSKDNSIEDVVNYINYNDTFSSSGQPTKHQFSLIRQAGYAVVINLAPYDLIENPLKDEEAIVTTLGMKYVHIPVNFFKPTQEDFDTFVNTMQSSSGTKIWVHCAVNMRASAFSYKYRCSILGEDMHTAIWDLREIWEPFGAWKKFVFGEKPAPV
jgi:protein tyrosine phosphatase (PTP) superfamily phosphohydrolase (DUF442 family)